MDILQSILEISKYVLPALVSALVVYIMLEAQNKKEKTAKQYDLWAQNAKELTPIRLQAYERLVLLMERISPEQLVLRLRQPEQTAVELQYFIISSIKQEFEHNISQQLYVSQNVWSMICITKDQIIQEINGIASQLGTTATSTDLSKAVLEYYIQKQESTPTQRALDLIKHDFSSNFGV